MSDNWEPVNESARAPLKLASSFTQRSYGFHHTENLCNGYDPVERARIRQRLEAAIEISHLTDYQLLETSSSFKLYMKDAEDEHAIKFVLQELPAGTVIRHTLLNIEPDVDIKRMNGHCRHLNKTVKRMGLEDSIQFSLDQEARKILLLAVTKKAFFDFWHSPEFRQITEDYTPAQALNPPYRYSFDNRT